MTSERVPKEIRNPDSSLRKPDAMLLRVISRFIDYCNIDQFKEINGMSSEGVTIFGYDNRRKFTKSTWLNSEDRNESEDKFFGSVDKADKQKVIDNKSLRLIMQKPPGESKVNLQIQYDGVSYALVSVPTGYRFGKTKLKELLKESFKEQTKIEIVVT